MLLHDSRRLARTDDTGALVLLEAQDRGLWLHAGMDEGRHELQRALRDGPPGPLTLQAAIAAVHADAPSAEATDWKQIVALYDRLIALSPTPVVALNRAVALAMWQGPAAGLEALAPLAKALDAYGLYHAARADLLRRLGRLSDAAAGYHTALGLPCNEVERAFLASRLASVLGAKSDSATPP